jgi:hypothetical protein
VGSSRSSPGTHSPASFLAVAGCCGGARGIAPPGTYTSLRVWCSACSKLHACTAGLKAAAAVAVGAGWGGANEKEISRPMAVGAACGPGAVGLVMTPTSRRSPSRCCAAARPGPAPQGTFVGKDVNGPSVRPTCGARRGARWTDWRALQDVCPGSHYLMRLTSSRPTTGRFDACLL